MLAICCWAWSLPLSGVGIPSETPMETANFSFMNYYLLMISSGSGRNLCPLRLSVGAPSDSDPCSSCAQSHNLHDYICMSVLFYLEDLVSLVSSIPLALTLFLPPFLQGSLSSGAGGTICWRHPI